MIWAAAMIHVITPLGHLKAAGSYFYFVRPKVNRIKAEGSSGVESVSRGTLD